MYHIDQYQAQRKTERREKGEGERESEFYEQNEHTINKSDNKTQ